MANNKNKGFTIIEIIIAIAILTMLLTPIIKQLAQTMKVSRIAKEQQYANDNATYELELFQTSSTDKIAQLYPGVTPVESTVTCELFDRTNTWIGEVEYKVTSYDLGSVELGSRNSEYSKTVTVDDLSNKVGAYVSSDKSYRVAYDITDADATAWAYEGFVLTNENSYVRYNSSGFVDGVICDVAIDETDANKITDPNTTNLGYVQDLDNDTVAIISGYSSNYDSQAETSIYARAMERIKSVDYDSWDQIVNGSGGIFEQAEYVNSMKKCTKIYIDKLTDDVGKMYYLVKADVYYYTDYVYNGSPLVSDTFSYNVYTKKFYNLDRCPDVYFEYQPYTMDKYYDSGTYTMEYASNDYVIFENYVPDAKLYLYKPNADHLNISDGKGTGVEEKNKYYTSTSMNDKVTITLANANPSVVDLNVFTNLLINTPGETSQFAFSNFDSLFTFVQSDKSGMGNSRTAFDETLLKQIEDDTRYEDRLQTITVNLVPEDEGMNSVSLTGAKGVN